jgi:hypothetical protein
MQVKGAKYTLIIEKRLRGVACIGSDLESAPLNIPHTAFT